MNTEDRLSLTKKRKFTISVTPQHGGCMRLDAQTDGVVTSWNVTEGKPTSSQSRGARSYSLCGPFGNYTVTASTANGSGEVTFTIHG